LILAGLAVITSAVLALEGTAAPVSVVAGGTIAGVGMGLAYPVLSSSLFDLPDSPRASTIGAAAAFAATAGLAWAALVAGGIFRRAPRRRGGAARAGCSARAARARRGGGRGALCAPQGPRFSRSGSRGPRRPGLRARRGRRDAPRAP